MLGRMFSDLLQHRLADVHHPQLVHVLQPPGGQGLLQEVDVLLVNVDRHPSPQAWRLSDQSPPCGLGLNLNKVEMSTLVRCQH